MGDSQELSVSSTLASVQDDKCKSLSNEMAVTFLGLLAAVEFHTHQGGNRRIWFRSFAISSRTNMVVSIL